ncbi:MAG TPA: glycosyltransferase, partial [Gemmatimonadales bacterium]|nr:glycosyltransferase [Gemmatimonadales bacterium]
GRTVLFVGRLLPHKGPDVLIEAARPSWQVRLVGSALDQRYLSDLNRLAEGKSVRFDHGADDAALEAAYQSAAVVVVPSLPRDRYGAVTPVAELLGLVAIEAGARGIPVVASNTASLPEIVVDGVTGFLVPPGDVGALRERVDAVLSDEPLRRRLGEAARRHVTERFSWRAAAAVAIDTYRRICSQ